MIGVGGVGEVGDIGEFVVFDEEGSESVGVGSKRRWRGVGRGWIIVGIGSVTSVGGRVVESHCRGVVLGEAGCGAM